MTREQLFEYVKNEYGTDPDYPWDKDFESAVLRHRNTKKWYALVMYVRADKLGYDSLDFLSVITLKAEMLLIDTLVLREGFHRAYHMNKTQWMTIELESGVSEENIKDLLDKSYELTEKKSKARRDRRLLQDIK